MGRNRATGGALAQEPHTSAVLMHRQGCSRSDRALREMFISAEIEEQLKKMRVGERRDTAINLQREKTSLFLFGARSRGRITRCFSPPEEFTEVMGRRAWPAWGAWLKASPWIRRRDQPLSEGDQRLV